MTVDVTEILTDPDLATTFNVIRRVETIDSHGVSSVAQQTTVNVIGVVTAISPNNLDRHEGYQTMGRSISVVTKFMLQGEVDDRQPDIVVWRGSNYVVKAIDPYPQFGNGFIQAECTSMDRTDPALESGTPPQLAFNQSNNSGYLGVI